MLISKESNKRKVTALTGAMLSIGSIMAISSTKANADTVRKANVEMQSSSVKNTIVTPAQNSLYQQNQKKSDNVEADKARAKAVEQQKQQAEKQNQQIQAQQNANNNQQNNNADNSNNNQANNNTNQNVGVAQGDNAVKAFEQASQNSVNQQEQNSINQSHQAVAQQAKDRQAHYQQMLQKVASASTTLQAKPSNNNNNSNNQAPTGSGSVYDQFIQAGGTPDMWKYIVIPESSGNPSARNGRYSGLFQTDKGNGTAGHSVAQQTQWALQYAKERYGSVQGAIQFRRTHNWW